MSQDVMDSWVWLKSLHLIAVIAWMAGLLYLPRLFVYHVEASGQTAVTDTLATMERRLLQRIMTPAMLATWAAGLWLAFTPGAIDWSAESWIHAKLPLVAALTAFHFHCAAWRKQLASGSCRRSARFFRIANEVPAVIMAIIVVLAIVKPF